MKNKFDNSFVYLKYTYLQLVYIGHTITIKNATPYVNIYVYIYELTKNRLSLCSAHYH